MRLFTRLKAEALEALRGLPGLEGALITDEYPAVFRPENLLKPVLSVGFQEFRMEHAAFSGLIGLSEDGTEETGRKCEAIFLFTLCAPKGEAAKVLFDLFAVLGELLLPESGFPVLVTSLKCDPVVFDRTMGCPVLRVYAKSGFLIPDGWREAGPVPQS